MEQRMCYCITKTLTSSSLKRPALQMRSKSSPPAAYSMTIARWVGVSITCMSIINRNPSGSQRNWAAEKRVVLTSPNYSKLLLGPKVSAATKSLLLYPPPPKKERERVFWNHGWVGKLASLMHAKHRNAKKGFSEIMGGRVGGKFTSLNRTMFGCRSDLWLMISLCTFSSIWCKERQRQRLGLKPYQDFSHKRKLLTLGGEPGSFPYTSPKIKAREILAKYCLQEIQFHHTYTFPQARKTTTCRTGKNLTPKQRKEKRRKRPNFIFFVSDVHRALDIHLLPTLDVLDGNKLARLLVTHQSCHSKIARSYVFHQLITLHIMYPHDLQGVHLSPDDLLLPSRTLSLSLSLALAVSVFVYLLIPPPTSSLQPTSKKIKIKILPKRRKNHENTHTHYCLSHTQQHTTTHRSRRRTRPTKVDQDHWKMHQMTHRKALRKANSHTHLVRSRIHLRELG